MNISVTVDETEFKLKVMYKKSGTVVFKEYDLDKDVVTPKVNYEKAFDALKRFSQDTGIHSASVVYVIPDKYIACKFIEIPSFSTKKLDETLDLQISTRFPQSEKLRVAYVPIGTFGVNCTYFAYMLKNELIYSIASAFKQNKFTLKYITFASAMTASAYLFMRTLWKKETLMLVDVKDGFTRLILLKDSKLGGFASLPYGNELLLSSEKITSAPPILTTEQMFTGGHRSSFELCTAAEGDPSDNIEYLVSAVESVCIAAKRSYHVDVPLVKYNLDKKYASLLNSFADKHFNHEPLTIKSPIISNNLELYGALNPKKFFKGLLF